MGGQYERVTDACLCVSVFADSALSVTLKSQPCSARWYVHDFQSFVLRILGIVCVCVSEVMDAFD